MDDHHNEDIELSPLLESLAAEYAENPKSKKFLPLAEEYRKSRMYEEAVYYLREGLKLYPDFQPAKITLARCMLETQEYDEALEMLTQLNIETPNNIPVLRMLGDTYMKLGDVQAAAETYSLIQKLNPEDRVSKEKLAEIERDFEGEIDISSLETPLVVPSASLKDGEAEEEKSYHEEFIGDEPDLDLEHEDKVEFDSLSIDEDEEQALEEVDISLISDDEEGIDAQQGADALREAVEEQSDDVESLELDLDAADLDEIEEDSGEKEPLTEEPDIESLELGEFEVETEAHDESEAEEFTVSDDGESEELILDVAEDDDSTAVEEEESTGVSLEVEAQQQTEEDAEADELFIEDQREEIIADEELTETESAALEIEASPAEEENDEDVPELRTDEASQPDKETEDAAAEEDDGLGKTGEPPFDIAEPDDDQPLTLKKDAELSSLEAALTFDSIDVMDQEDDSLDRFDIEIDDESVLDSFTTDEDEAEETGGESLEFDDEPESDQEMTGEHEPEKSEESEDEDVLVLSMDQVDEGAEEEASFDPPDQTTEEQPEHDREGYTSDENEIIAISLEDIDPEEREQLESEAMELPVDAIEVQGKPPAIEDFSLPEEEQRDTSIYDLTLEDDSAGEAVIDQIQEFDDERGSLLEESESGDIAEEQQAEEQDFDELIPITESSAKVFREQGDLHKTREIYSRLVSSNPENVRYRESLAKVEQQLKQEEQSLELSENEVIEVLENWLENILLYKESLHDAGEGK